MDMAADIATFQRHVGAPEPQRLEKFKNGNFAGPAAGISAQLTALSTQAKTMFKATNDGRWLRVELMLEELAEAIQGMALNNEEQTLDGLVDLVYVTIGTANALDLPFNAAFNEVHRSNMTKTSSAARHSGNKGKGPNFKPANICAILEQFRANR